jgi:hypothetical protein
MTQELAVGVLLAGLVGLLWVLTCAILSGDHAAAGQDSKEKEPHAEHNDQQRMAPERGRVAA